MQPVHEMLAKAAREYPFKGAFVHKDKKYTFCEIDEASTKLAGFLLGKGIEPGQRIGIFSAKNIEEIIALFAILKMGCVLVHINPHFKEQQLAHIIADCEISVLFLHASKQKVFKNANLAKNAPGLIISLSTNRELEAAENVCSLSTIINETPLGQKFDITVGQDDTAAIIYTSGSTGKPKGIIVTHKILSDATTTSAQVLGNNSDDRLISVTPFSFDGALSQLFTSVMVGGTLVLQESTFPKDIVATIINEKITGFHAVPSYWRMLLQKHSPFAKHEYPHLRYISIIGEAFPQDELKQLTDILIHTQVFMMYGITEAFRSTYLAPEDFPHRPCSVGKPFPGVEICIINENGGKCAAGEIGEIVHKGAFVSPGYWNSPEKTTQVFRNGALYTGDLGKFDAEGFLYFVGRKDAMLKSMGYRISPEEIEQCIRKMEGITEAAVTAAENEAPGSRIKAIIVPSRTSTITQQEVITYCRKELPYYMVPSIVEFVSEIPKTANYKINRSQLS